MSDEVVLCKDCRHSFRSIKEILFGYAPLRCRLTYYEAGVKIDPVTGPKKFKAGYRSCDIERSFAGDKCKQEGKLWEPKDKKNFFVYLKRVG